MLVFYAQNIYFLQKNMVKEQAKGKETTCWVDGGVCPNFTCCLGLGWGGVGY